MANKPTKLVWLCPRFFCVGVVIWLATAVYLSATCVLVNKLSPLSTMVWRATFWSS